MLTNVAFLVVRLTNSIVVTFNYRVGVWGFYADEALQAENEIMNYGLQDQQWALKWVQKCIGAFGGM